MSKLKELIQQYCHNGVVYKRISTICNISRGVVMSKDFIRDNEGEYPVYSSQTENNGELGRISTYRYDGEYLTWTTDGANAGSVFYRCGRFSITNVCGLLEVKNRQEMLVKFLYYSLSIAAPKYVNKGMGNAKLMSNVMATVEVPVPPMEVQREIVHILDYFAFYTSELSAELSARREQYNYYRDKLLACGTNTKWKRLADIASFTYGYTDKAQEVGNTRFIRITDILDNGTLNPVSAKYINLNNDSRKYLLKTGDILMARTGATYGKTVYIPNDSPAVYASFLIRIDLNNDVILNRYYWHFAQSRLYWDQANKLVSTGGQPQFNTVAAGKVKVPIIDLDAQRKIVEILDKFDSICSDLSLGLPAEIEERQRQYEYYRDKLLGFKRINNDGGL